MKRLDAVAEHLRPRPDAPAPAAAAAAGGGGSELRLRPRAVPAADIIFGTGPMTDKYDADHTLPDGKVFKYRGPTQAEADAAVHAALAAGVAGFDTAPLYGNSEDMLGCALAASPLGSRAVVYTKAGKLVRRIGGASRVVSTRPPSPWSPFAVPTKDRVMIADYSFAGARRSLDESLERMALRRCHTLRIHDPDQTEGTLDEAAGPGGLVAGLRALRDEGRITHVSIGMNANAAHRTATAGEGGLETTPWRPSVIIDLIRAAPPRTFDSALFAYGWNLATQDAWPVMQECARRGIEVHVAGIFGGVYHVNVGSQAAAHGKEARRAIRGRMATWRELAARHGVTVEAVAVAFAALPSVVTKVVMGMKSVDEVRRNLAAAEGAAAVPHGIWREAQAAGILPAHLPL